MTEKARAILRRGAAELGLQLKVGDLQMLEKYGDELKKWNAKINLTAIRNDEEIVVKHFLDSLTLGNQVRRVSCVLDIGSGAGFPSIPLKIITPDLKVVTVDAVEKKILFQRHVIRLLGLQGIEAIHGRAEKLVDRYRESFDLVVSRAFSDIPTFARMALPLVSPNGVVVAMKGREGVAEAEAASGSLEEMGGYVSEIQELMLPVTADYRSLILIRRKNT